MLSVKISETESCRSLFERAIQKEKLPAMACFLEKGSIHPVLFEEKAGGIQSEAGGEVEKLFSKTSGKHRFRILRASRINESPRRGMRVAVLFSGGPSAGGHNVLVGMKHILGLDNTLLGVSGGPRGLLEGNLFPIEEESISAIANTGGFDFLGSDRTKIKTQQEMQTVARICAGHKLDAVVIIGGDDSNTNAALLAEHLIDQGVQVIGVPKTIDGDLQAGAFLPISFGFDTATKIYAEMVGNILQDTPSSRKYWHFVKLMGRSASHVTLEVALQTKPAMALISEEIEEQKSSLKEIVDTVAQVVIRRSRGKINHGVVLVPEGLIEFIPEIRRMIEEIDEIIITPEAVPIDGPFSETERKIKELLSSETRSLFLSLPEYVRKMMLSERDSHGNLQVSLIPTERLLVDMVRERIAKIDPSVPFKTHCHFFGYEGRCGAPSRFDAMYTYNLGLTAGSMVLAGMTGYMASVSDFSTGGGALALPLSGLIHMEKRHGKKSPVIAKALVRTDSPAFRYFAERREIWREKDVFSSPGPRQWWGPSANQLPFSVALDQGYGDWTFTV